MATKKSKSSSKSVKESSSKPKTSPKSKETSDVTDIKDNNEAKKSPATTESVKTDTEAEKVHTITAESDTKKPLFKGFFARKYAEKESILTIFKNPRFYGALIGEVIGTLFLTLLIFAMFMMGLPNIATYALALIALIIAVYAFSGSCLNPIITVGMMATRRISVIRGIMYIIAEILGSWLGWLIFNGFHGVSGEAAYDVPAITALAEGSFWPIAFIEILGAFIISFFYARGLKYKRSALTFGAVAAGSVVLAYITGYVVAVAFLGANNSFVMNPAISMMLQIFPTSGADFGEIFGGIMQSLSLYVFLPMVAGVVGFYLADCTARLSGEE